MKLTMAILASMGALASAACPTSLPAGKHEIPLSFANENRKFFLKIPESVDVTTERPLVISWHGCGSSPEKFEDESLLDVNVGNYQMYNIYPEGTTTGTSLGWNAGWDAGSCQTSRENPPDDIEFAKKILQWVDENMCVDMEKVFIAGFSNGGQMTYKLNCELSDRFAGMMTIGMSAGSSLTPGQDARCQPAKTLPHLNMCGTNDFICARGWEKQFEDWAVVNNCTDSPVTTDHSSTTKCYKHSACSVNGQQVKVEACGINGLGHCWPGNNCCDAQCANQDPANIDGSDYMLNFLLENGVSLQ